MAQELLEQGDARRLCVLCPPHLAEQWQKEMATKFHLDATLVLPSTAGRLERTVRRGVGESIFERLDITVVSTDFIKSPSRRDDFLRAAPELVIVDEAHTCVADTSTRGGTAAHQRHELLIGLAKNPERHLVLVTATPHSGKEGAFPALLHLLTPPSATCRTTWREKATVPSGSAWPGTSCNACGVTSATTWMPQHPSLNASRRSAPTDCHRITALSSPTFSPMRGRLSPTLPGGCGANGSAGGRPLPCYGRWPRAGSRAATLLVLSAPGEAATVEEADEVGRRTVMDLADEDAEEATDVAPGADPTEEEDEGTTKAEDKAARRRLRAFADGPAALAGSEGDTKLSELVRVVRRLLEEGHRPIVFCRFIPRPTTWPSSCKVGWESRARR